MKKIVLMLVILSLWIACSEMPNTHYSTFPQKDMTYRLSDGYYTNFEHYMFDEGFPDSIIIELKRDSLAVYMKIPRYTILKDSLGNFYSPGYALFGNDCIILYDIKGRQVTSNDE